MTTIARRRMINREERMQEVQRSISEPVDEREIIEYCVWCSAPFVDQANWPYCSNRCSVEAEGEP